MNDIIRIISADGKAEEALYQTLTARATETDRSVTAAVDAIIADVRQNGDEALRRYNLKFDGVDTPVLEVPAEVLSSAADRCDPALRNALSRAADNIRRFHERQRQTGYTDQPAEGVTLGVTVRGLNRVGLYVPGGTAAYPSSVLMNAIPAKIAGVRELIMITPPPKTEGALDGVLAAAQIAGVDRVFTVGGAQGIAAMAYGTGSIPAVDKIVGPGNIYVATAKRQVFGKVDIDMIAGPSEILIVADESATPAFLAADLMSQAEHDPLASAILLCTDRNIALRTADELERQCANLSRAGIIRQALCDYGAIVVLDSVDEALRTANRLAPEHLELCIANAADRLPEVVNAGSVFVGHYSPEPLGDYYAGVNHVLPTGGTARFFSPLSVDSFIKKQSFVQYDRAALLAAAEDILTLTAAEGLTAHGNAIAIRQSEEDA